MIELTGKEKVQNYPNKVIRKPLVSVLVQTYNHENYIKECLDGILMQQVDFDYEILLSEDDSSDNTRAICIEYADKFPTKIRLFLHDRSNNIKINGQPTGRYCFIWNMQYAKGKYIALCDGDDYWKDPLKLQKQIDFLEVNQSYVLSCHNASIINEKKEEIRKSKLSIYYQRDFSSDDLIITVQILTLSMCFRNVINFFPTEFFKALNGDRFLMSMLGIKGKAKYQKNITPAVYRIHNKGMWSIMAKEFQNKSHEQTFYNLYKFHSKNKTKKELVDKLYSRYYSFVTKNLKYYFFKDKKIKGLVLYFDFLAKSIVHGKFKYTFFASKKVIKYFVFRRKD